MKNSNSPTTATGILDISSCLSVAEQVFLSQIQGIDISSCLSVAEQVFLSNTSEMVSSIVDAAVAKPYFEREKGRRKKCPTPLTLVDLKFRPTSPEEQRVLAEQRKEERGSRSGSPASTRRPEPGEADATQRGRAPEETSKLTAEEKARQKFHADFFREVKLAEKEVGQRDRALQAEAFAVQTSTMKVLDGEMRRLQKERGAGGTGRVGKGESQVQVVFLTVEGEVGCVLRLSPLVFLH